MSQFRFLLLGGRRIFPMHRAAVFQFLQDIKRSFFMYVGNVDCIKFCVFVYEAGLL